MLPFTIALRAGLPVHDQVVYAVTRATVSGQLRPGDPFPSVRALGQELRINPNTAHRIVASLIEDGLLSVRPGIGTVVSETAPRVRSARRSRVEEETEHLVVEARRSGLSLPQLLETVRRHWSATIDVASSRRAAR